MKKLTKTIHSTATAFSLLASSGLPNIVSANAQQTEDVQSTQSEAGTYAIQLKPGQLVKLGFSVISYASNTWFFHREATEYVGQTQLEVSRVTSVSIIKVILGMALLVNMM